MTVPIPTHEPNEFVAGSTVKFIKSLPDYPASEWTLSFHLRGPGSLDVEAVAAESSGDHLITLTADQTADLEAGTYYWQAWVFKDDEKFLIGEGRVEIKPGLNVKIENFDGRSKAKKLLDAIDATLEGRATKDLHMYMIGNRQLMRIPVEQLISLRREYARLYAREQRNARVRRGGSLFSNVKVRFDSPK